MKQKTSTELYDDELKNKILRLRKYFVNSGNDAERFKYAMFYLLTLKDSRNNELLRFISNYVDLFAPNNRVLEIGSGMGGFLEFLQKQGIEAYGFDIDKSFVKLGFAKNAIVADVCRQPVKEGTFNIILALDVIEHIPNQHECVREMMATVKKGGKIVVLTNNRIFPFDSDTKLFFINYLPQKLADKYLQFRRKRSDVVYDIKTPTFFGFPKLCQKDPRYKITVRGVFTVFGYYVEQFKILKKIGSVLEQISYDSKTLGWIQWFAPKLCLVIEKTT